ncbi:MAG TPA: hypothetical protein VHB21_09695, partial [Minicystis sp.]|nr:hypothetical protein [Minicystis sp.]
MAGSTLLLDEYFEREDPRFLDELYASKAEKKLQALGARWASDARPFARAALLSYIDDGCDRPHHRPLVKKLFKELEQKGDDEALAHFAVAFDRLVRRALVRRTRWDVAAGEVTSVTRLRTEYPAPWAGDDGVTFSLVTRQYLRRRGFRYFRRIAHADLARYRRGVARALALYEDAHLARPEQLLDAWTFVHVVYGESPVIERRARGVVVAPGRALSELEPAPMFPEAWRGAFADVLGLALAARARPVRAFA